MQRSDDPAAAFAHSLGTTREAGGAETLPLSAAHFEERGFHDALYEWMERTPWLAVSIAAHLLVFFVIVSIPWNAFERVEPPVVYTGITPPEVDPFVELPEPDPKPVDTPIEPDEPLPVDTPIADTIEQTFADADDGPVSDAVAELDALPSGEPLLNGIGGGPSGHLRGRGVGGCRGGGGRHQTTVQAGLAWLAAHQSEDGHWDGEEFDQHCDQGSVCAGPGHATHDVGLTGLALLAFLGDGHNTAEGAYRDVVARGVRWLKRQQDLDSGLIGPRSTRDFLYGHTIATLALCEAFGFTGSPQLRRPAQTAVHFLQRARAPYGAWRYAAPSDGTSDSSVTGWAVFALAAAEDAGLEVDLAAFDAALGWFDFATDPATGRCGYQAPGELSSRTAANEHFPREKGEALTAVALLSRFFCGQDPAEHPTMDQQADLLVRSLPEWDPEGFGCDMYYWYYGTYALFQRGGSRHWKPWDRALKGAVVDTQREDGHARGSWDPVGPWGHVGGRIYSTALMTLTLQVHYRYPRLLGARAR